MSATPSVGRMAQAELAQGDSAFTMPGQQNDVLPVSLALKLCVLAAALGALLQRTPQILYRPQFWAEDALVFFRAAYENPLSSILEPYSGYYLLLPRLMALAASPLPFRLIPAAYAWMSVAAMLLVCALALSPRLNLRPNCRCIVALAVVLAPASHEVFSCLTNSQWIVALTLVLIASSSPAQTLREKTRDVVVLIAAGLSGPFSVFFAPLFALRAVRERSRFSVLLLVVVVICAGIQSVHLPAARIPGTVSWHNPDFVRAFGFHGWNLFTAYFARPASWAVSLVLASGTAFAYLAMLWNGLRRPAPAAVAFALASLLSLGAALWAYRASPITVTAGGRYFYIPAVTAIWGMAALLPSRLSIAGLALAAASSIAWLAHPARFVNYHWSDASRCIGVTDPCVIPVNPPGWELVIRPRPTR